MNNSYLYKHSIDDLLFNIFGVVDFETTLIKKGTQSFLCAGIFDFNVFKYYESIESVIEYLIKSENKIFFFHNLSYDYRFILEYLLDNFDVDIISKNSHVLKITVMQKNSKVILFELRDSYALIPLSLKKISKSFCNKYRKLDFDIENIETLFESDKKKVIEYLELDCLSLYEALDNFFNIMESKKNKIPITITCMALQKWKSMSPIKYSNLLSSEQYDYSYRKSYFAGRTEIFKLKCYSGFYYDFNSLYPDVMKHNEFPYGNPIKLNSEMQYFIADCIIHIPETENISCIPVRTKNNKVYFPVGKIRGWYNSVDIKLAQSQNYDVEILNGFGWENSSPIFYNYISKYYNLKKKSKENNNLGLYECSKLSMNSLYGKFGEKSIRDIITTIPNINSLIKESKLNKTYLIDLKHHLFSCQKNISRGYSTTYISSFITSLAREKLFLKMKEIQNKGGEIYYCDTDSIMTDIILDTSEHIGDLKLEHEIKNGYFALPKLYAFQNIKGETIIKCKGLGYNTVCYDDIKNFVELGEKIESKTIRISTLKNILRNSIKYTDCYELLREVKYNPAIFKRKILNKYNTMPYNINEIK